jgi:hypothetical protein
MRRLTIIGILSFAAGFNLCAQNITNAEYFFDGADPGFGSATAITVSPSASINETFNVDLTAVTDGLHTINYRVAQTSGVDLVWSLTYTTSFYKVTTSIPIIEEIEYFVDTDPGFGSGQAITITPGATVSTNFLVNISALSTGVHILNVRAKDDNGSWSMIHSLPFYVVATVSANITTLEYFFDSDPGFGNGTSATITPGASINESLNINWTTHIEYENERCDWPMELNALSSVHEHFNSLSFNHKT